MKNIIIAVVGLLIIAGGIYYFIQNTNSEIAPYERPTETDTENQSDLEENQQSNPTEPSAAPEAAAETSARGDESTIGTSVSGNEIKAYHFGTGDDEVTFIGGIHGGYSWNTALLAFEVIDWLKANPSVVPENMTVTIIPVLNPDGLAAVTGNTGRFTATDLLGVTEAAKVAARFNEREVDLNRNFACDWEATGTWQNRSVSGGSEAFSEPESQAIRNYVDMYKPKAIVTWFSSAGGVYASGCNGKTPDGTAELTARYAAAANYTAYAEYNYYELTGDMVNWFASENIPAISVLLTNHTDTELAKNQAGITALLNYLSE